MRKFLAPAGCRADTGGDWGDGQRQDDADDAVPGGERVHQQGQDRVHAAPPRRCHVRRKARRRGGARCCRICMFNYVYMFNHMRMCLVALPCSASTVVAQAAGLAASTASSTRPRTPAAAFCSRAPAEATTLDCGSSACAATCVSHHPKCGSLPPCPWCCSTAAGWGRRWGTASGSRTRRGQRR